MNYVRLVVLVFCFCFLKQELLDKKIYKEVKKYPTKIERKSTKIYKRGNLGNTKIT